MISNKMNSAKRKIFFLCGVMSIMIGIIGMFLPLLPTTPFLILATVCFAKSSEKAHKWLLTNRWCGEYIKNYREKKGISLRHKIFSLSLLWITIGYSVLFVAEHLWLQFLLIAIAITVTLHIASFATYKKKYDGTLSDTGAIPNSECVHSQKDNKQ